MAESSGTLWHKCAQPKMSTTNRRMFLFGLNLGNIARRRLARCSSPKSVLKQEVAVQCQVDKFSSPVQNVQHLCDRHSLFFDLAHTVEAHSCWCRWLNGWSCSIAISISHHHCQIFVPVLFSIVSCSLGISSNTLWAWAGAPTCTASGV